MTIMLSVAATARSGEVALARPTAPLVASHDNTTSDSDLNRPVGGAILCVVMLVVIGRLLGGPDTSARTEDFLQIVQVIAATATIMTLTRGGDRR